MGGWRVSTVMKTLGVKLYEKETKETEGNGAEQQKDNPSGH
jgi:hypothetical protein